jgi:hypothetical protein
MNARDVLLKPLITEKSMDLMEENKYTFLTVFRLSRFSTYFSLLSETAAAA